MHRSPDSRSASGRVIDHPNAVAAAMRHFVQHGDVNMQDLADELAVGRATLYRVVGNRDQLLGDVLWELSERTLQIVLDEATEAGLSGVERLMAAATSMSRRVRAFEPLQRLLEADSLTAFRVLFSPAGGVHERMVDTWEALYTQAYEAEGVPPPFAVDKLAYLHVRIDESMIYADLFAGRDPDLELAETIRRGMLTLQTP